MRGTSSTSSRSFGTDDAENSSAAAVGATSQEPMTLTIILDGVIAQRGTPDIIVYLKQRLTSTNTSRTCRNLPVKTSPIDGRFLTLRLSLAKALQVAPVQAKREGFALHLRVR